MMHNNLDAIEAGDVESTNLWTVQPFVSRVPVEAKRTKADRPANEHVAIPLRELPGYPWREKPQQWCAVCKKEKDLTAAPHARLPHRSSPSIRLSQPRKDTVTVTADVPDQHRREPRKHAPIKLKKPRPITVPLRNYL